MSARGVRGRLRVAREALATPADVLLLVRMLGWAPLLPLLKYVVPLRRLVRLAAAPPRRSERDRAEEARIARLAQLLYRGQRLGVRDNCLERSLLTYRYLGRANADPRLVVGVRKDESGVLGHVWVTVDGEPVHDPPQALDDLVPMMSFDAAGAVTTPR